MDETDLRRRLRGLPRDIEPSRDLWPGIAARLPPRAARAPRRSRRPWFAGMAIAACLCVAVGVAYTLRPAVPVDHGAAPVSLAAPGDARHDLLVREADAMTLEYEAALRCPRRCGRHWRRSIAARWRSAVRSPTTPTRCSCSSNCDAPTPAA